MQNSIERVRAVINGEIPDRTPLFDLLRNDAVIEYFSGRRLTLENAPEVVYKAYEPAVDATRPQVKLPAEEKTLRLPDGRQQKQYRWTAWTEPHHYADSEAYAAAKRAELDTGDPSDWRESDQHRLDAALTRIAGERQKLGEIFLFPGIPGPGLMGLYGEVGIKQFSYALADCPGIIPALLEFQSTRAATWYEHLPPDHGIEAGFLGDDIAFNAGPLFSLVWLRAHYFPHLSRIICAAHAKGIKVLFHSDGNLNPILDDLVQAGIDGLNPIEVLAGMDVGDIHRRFPHLFLAGGIDVSWLLPLGSPQQVANAVKQAIDAAEGRIMIGSSTELNNEVPLQNYLALRKAVLEKT
ncbi:hypothetical protein JXJ21_25935 [candidate division KSB1 bacterium]|nr:hypothetical protein [candidate division KSB1 bacterium]